MNSAPRVLSRPDLGDADPARRLLLPIPVELHEDPPDLVDVDLRAAVLALDDEGRLDARDFGLAGDERGAELTVARRHLVMPDIACAAAAPARAVGLGFKVMCVQWVTRYSLFSLASGWLVERDERAGKQRRRGARRGAALVERLGGFKLVFGELLADSLIHEIVALRVDVTIRIVKHLHGIVGVAARVLRLREQVGGWFLIAVIFQNEDAALRPARRATKSRDIAFLAVRRPRSDCRVPRGGPASG